MATSNANADELRRWIADQNFYLQHQDRRLGEKERAQERVGILAQIRDAKRKLAKLRDDREH